MVKKDHKKTREEKYEELTKAHEIYLKNKKLGEKDKGVKGKRIV